VKPHPACLAVLTVGLVACGARVTVGFLDGEPSPAEALDLADAGDVMTFVPADAGLDALPRVEPPSPGCTNKVCGALCTPPCERDSGSCPPPSVFHACSEDGLCLPEDPSCGPVISVADAGKQVPCVGLSCGAPCRPCREGAPGCTPASGPTVCRASGECGAPSACP
jgi:hypothetical protein